MKQARYSAENLGHFGLAFENYLHFTSPIRRYPDLVVHRVLRAMLQHRLSPTLKERMKSDFPALAEHASERERVAEEAERDLTRYYQALWAKDHLGESFNGVITGVTNFGIFVALPNGVEGLMHVSQLEDDYYMYLEDAMMLVGKHTKKKYRLGDRTGVKVLNANPTVRQIDLMPAHMEMPETSESEPEDRSRGGRRAPENLKTPLSAARPEEEKHAEREAGEVGGSRRSRRRKRPSSNTAPDKRVGVELEPNDQTAPQRQAEPAEAEPVRVEPEREGQETAPREAVPEVAPQITAPEPQVQPGKRKRRVLVFGDPGLTK